MERKLIDYLPYILREYRECIEITNGEQLEFELGWEATKFLLNNQFILSADDFGLSRWEKILKITPKGTDSLEERRSRILARSNEQLPYTLKQLRVMLETMCGPDNYSADIALGTYILIVKIGLAAKHNYKNVEFLLQRVVPANVVIQLIQLYNTHAELKRFTHAELSVYTHNQMRNEVLPNG